MLCICVDTPEYPHAQREALTATCSPSTLWLLSWSLKTLWNTHCEGTELSDLLTSTAVSVSQQFHNNLSWCLFPLIANWKNFRVMFKRWSNVMILRLVHQSRSPDLNMWSRSCVHELKYSLIHFENPVKSMSNSNDQFTVDQHNETTSTQWLVEPLTLNCHNVQCLTFT